MDVFQDDNPEGGEHNKNRKTPYGTQPVIIKGRRRPCLERHESVIKDIKGSVMTSSERANAMNKLKKKGINEKYTENEEGKIKKMLMIFSFNQQIKKYLYHKRMTYLI